MKQRRKNRRRVNETKSRFSEEMDRAGNQPAGWTRSRGEKAHVGGMRVARGLGGGGWGVRGTKDHEHSTGPGRAGRTGSLDAHTRPPCDGQSVRSHLPETCPRAGILPL